jgi:nucleotide-binding universal stress UspA family protein
MYKRILVPLDGSMQAEKAMEPAILLAKVLSAEMLLVRVVPTVTHIAPTLDIPWQTKKAEKQQRQTSEAYLRAMRTSGIKHGVRIDRAEVLSGLPAVSINQLAVSENIDLIIFTNRGRGGQKTWRVGSVAMKLARGAPCDTLIVRTDAREPLTLKRILVALDGSNLAENALKPAQALADATEAETILFRVTPPVELAIGSEEAEAIMPNLQGQVEQYLGKIRDRWTNGRTVKISAQTGPVAQSILDQAEKKMADLIVLAAHGANESKQWSLGGVANKVVLGARRAVLIVRTTM